jgi:uncharacterized repeat protein (TIGR03987 family)
MKWHVIAFWLGLLFDMLGTYNMHIIAKKQFDILELHTFAGQTALILMLVLVIWATYVIKKKAVKNRRNDFTNTVYLSG